MYPSPGHKGPATSPDRDISSGTASDIARPVTDLRYIFRSSPAGSEACTPSPQSFRKAPGRHTANSKIFHSFHNPPPFFGFFMIYCKSLLGNEQGDFIIRTPSGIRLSSCSSIQVSFTPLRFRSASSRGPEALQVPVHHSPPLPYGSYNRLPAPGPVFLSFHPLSGVSPRPP